MVENLRLGLSSQAPTIVQQNHVHEIDPTMLHDPVQSSSGQMQECYLGSGAFGIVKFQLYRGMPVAVKELLPRALKADVRHEAEILACLCHPYLPYLFGMCTLQQPLRIVMQFYGFIYDAGPVAVTLWKELQESKIVKE